MSSLPSGSQEGLLVPPFADEGVHGRVDGFWPLILCGNCSSGSAPSSQSSCLGDRKKRL